MLCALLIDVHLPLRSVTYSRALANGGALTLPGARLVALWLSCRLPLRRSLSLSISLAFCVIPRPPRSLELLVAIRSPSCSRSFLAALVAAALLAVVIIVAPFPSQDVRRTYRHRQYHSGRLRRGCERPRCRCRRRRRHRCCCVVVDFAHCVCVGQEEEQERPHAGARGRVRRQQPLLSACDQRVGT